MRTRLSGFAASAGLAVLVSSCHPDPAGPVTGVIRRGGVPWSHAVVTAYPAGLNPRSDTLPPGSRAIPDEDGRFGFRGLRPGEYNLLAVSDPTADSPQRWMAWLPGIRFGRGQEPDLEGLVLRPQGAIRIPKGDGVAQGEGYLYVPGSPWFLDLTPSDPTLESVVLPGVAAATYRELRWVGGEADLDLDAIGDSLVVAPAETATVDLYHAWTHRRSWRVRSGMEVPEGGIQVLLRLDSSSFDFRQARGEGQDLRFTDSAGLRLPHQAERWDSAGGRAELWVRLPDRRTAQAGFRMHWGREGAVDVSRPHAVFPAADGFSAVWHLAEEDSGAFGSPTYRNSSRDGDHGLDHLPGADRTGMIGHGHGFDTAGHIRVPYATPALRPAASFTVSAWYRADSTDSLGSVIAAMGESWGLRVDKDGSFRPFLQLDSAFRTVDSAARAADGRWHHLAATYDGEVLHAYLDGKAAGRLAVTASFDYGYGKDFFIGTLGRFKGGHSVVGWLDEVQVSTVARSPEWIRFVFETQKPGSSALEAAGP